MINLRAAVLSDANNLWLWRNDKATRKSAFSMDRVPWADHKAWFARRLADKNSQIYIIELAGKPVGQVRIDRHGKTSEVDIAVAPEARGKGIAAQALKHPFPNAHSFIAHIKPDNVASTISFLKAGYRIVGMATVKGNKCIKLVKP